VHYLLSVIDDATTLASDDEMTAITAFNHRLRDNGHFVYANGLTDPSLALRIDNRSGDALIENGTLVTGLEHYSGCWIIDAESPELAKALATEASACCNRKFELRPFHG